MSSAGTKGVPRGDRERQLLDIATVEFGRRGYAATSLASIADVAGVSKPMTVAYFGSKEGLYLACLSRAIDNLADRIEVAMATNAATRAMADAVLGAIFSALEARPHDWNVIWDRTQPEGSSAHIAAVEARSRLSDQAVRGVAMFGDAALNVGGLTPDPLDVSLLAYAWQSVVTGIVNWWLRHPDQSAVAMTARSTRVLASIAAAGEAVR